MSIYPHNTSHHGNGKCHHTVAICWYVWCAKDINQYDFRFTGQSGLNLKLVKCSLGTLPQGISFAKPLHPACFMLQGTHVIVRLGFLALGWIDPQIAHSFFKLFNRTNSRQVLQSVFHPVTGKSKWQSSQLSNALGRSEKWNSFVGKCLRASLHPETASEVDKPLDVDLSLQVYHYTTPNVDCNIIFKNLLLHKKMSP